MHIKGMLDPTNFRSNRRTGQLKGGDEAYWKALKAHGYPLPTIEDAAMVLNEIGSDLEDDF